MDVIVFAFANQTSCVIKIYYQDLDGSFDMHHITPDAPSRGVIELAFMNAHYDLITNIAKQEGVTQTPNFLATLTENSAVHFMEVMSNESTIGEHD